MKSKQNKDYIVGMYVRLSRDDERAGESLSIENQKAILGEYIEKQGWTLYDVYVDDGISGTTFERPGVKRLLEDAKQGVINTILVKDMSRFGRNYILVGQYLDYVFPAFGIRFVALSDNIDTENKDTAAMDMMSPMCSTNGGLPLRARNCAPCASKTPRKAKTECLTLHMVTRSERTRNAPCK